MVGCYAEPTCTVAGFLGGGVSGEIAWVSSGQDECAMTYDGIEFNKGEDQLTFSADIGLEWKVGSYDGARVTFSTGDRNWSSSDCTINIASRVREDWTKSDYFYITGALACPPLESLAGDPSITLGGVSFGGYFVEEY